MYLKEDALVVDLITDRVLNVSADLLLDDVVLLLDPLDSDHAVLVKFVEIRTSLVAQKITPKIVVHKIKLSPNESYRYHNQ